MMQIESATCCKLQNFRGESYRSCAHCQLKPSKSAPNNITAKPQGAEAHYKKIS